LQYFASVIRRQTKQLTQKKFFADLRDDATNRIVFSLRTRSRKLAENQASLHTARLEEY